MTNKDKVIELIYKDNNKIHIETLFWQAFDMLSDLQQLKLISRLRQSIKQSEDEKHWRSFI